MPSNANELDKRLHEERAVPRRFVQRAHTARLSDVPNGAMFGIRGDGPVYLRWRDRFFPWHIGGYGEPLSLSNLPPDHAVAVLTPPTTLSALRGGYEPAVHPTAEG